jgi:fluoride exporter
MSGIYVFLGGGLGSLLRYAIGLGINRFQWQLPVSTLLANILACLVFAFVMYSFQDKPTISPQTKSLLLTGFCGGLSTFSAFSHETFLLIKQQSHWLAAGNILLNTLLCLLIFYTFNKTTS